MRFRWYMAVSSIVLAALTGHSAIAGNPIIKERFTADPATLVYDGKVYLYVGHDEAEEDGDFFVLREWSIYSSDNLKDWTLEGAFPRTAFEWARGDSAWAAQAIERDGQFYWYVTVLNDSTDPDKQGYALGVAVSDHPVHGWEDAIGGPLVTSNMTQAPEFMGEEPWDNIDPTVFIDDDGQAYLYWGNTHLYYARLKDNMVELDSEIHQVEIHNMPGTFTEAPWLHKYEEQYYLSFAMNYPEELAYAVSDSPEGPWEYQGLLMDVLPDSGTSHQAVLEYEGEWYLVYHTAALPTGGNYRRSVSIEHLIYNDDGSIQKITPTASGIHYDAKQLQTLAGEGMLTYQGERDVAVSSAREGSGQRWHLQSLHEDEQTVSLQPDTQPGFFLVANAGKLSIKKHDGTNNFIANATFKRVEGIADSNLSSFHLVENPELYLVVEEDRVTLKYPSSHNDRVGATFKIH